LLFAFLYTTLVSAVTVTSLPILLALTIKRKYRKSIPARFFLFRNSMFQNREVDFWFHGCSLGEINSLKPFLKEFKRESSVFLTTTTETGFNAGGDYQKAFLPFEPLLFFSKLKTKYLIVLEAELWFLLFFFAKTRGSKTTLLSGRMSDRSFPKYLKFRWFYKHIFKNIDLVLAQSEIDRERFLKLGAKRVEISGNVKLLKSESKRELDIPKDREIIVGASTHKDDEIYILEAFQKYGYGRLLLVPRHSERFEDIWKLVKDFSKAHNLTSSRYSENSSFNSDIVLVDTIGILIDIYSKSDIVILGGGFYDGIGGHNPVEPASFSNKIISGKFMFNQKELLKYISNIQIVDREHILDALKKSESTPISKIIGEDIEFKKIVNTLKNQ
jgi:3-deoxy-D-manno-octulosonic-acid transferase